jgi:hypothetical protein
MHQGQPVTGVAQQLVERQHIAPGQVPRPTDRQVAIVDARPLHRRRLVEIRRLAGRTQIDHLAHPGRLQRRQVASLQRTRRHAMRRGEADVGEVGEGLIGRRRAARGGQGGDGGEA